MQYRVSIPLKPASIGTLEFYTHLHLIEWDRLIMYTFYVLFPISVPVKKSFSRLLFHLEAVRLSPSFLNQRKFTANFDSDDDYVKFPSSSIFPGSSLAGLEVCSCALLQKHLLVNIIMSFYDQFSVCRCSLH